MASSSAPVRRSISFFSSDCVSGMTITVFLEAVREAGMILLDLGIRPDPNLERFAATRKTFPPGLKPMDLCLSGISCTLAFPHNI